MNKAFQYLVILLLFTGWACKTKVSVAVPDVPVNVVSLTSKEVQYFDTYPATTIALNQVNLLPQQAGAITKISFTEGSHVEKGQVLYEIDPRIYQANLDAAIANLRVQEGNLAQAKQDADRYDSLMKYNAVASQLYDHAKITYKNAKNQVKSAQEAVNTAKTSLKYSIVTAPFSGSIGLSQVKLGNVVSVGSPVLNTISTDDPMAVDFLINEKQLSKFLELQKTGGKGIDSLFTLKLPDNSLYPFTGKIFAIDRAVDPQTGTIDIRLVFANPQKILRPGMSCLVRVHNQETHPQLVIPNKAIVEQIGEYFLFMAHDTLVYDTWSGGDTTKLVRKTMAIQKKVVLGQTIGPNIIIKSGAKQGDSIVVDGIQTLHNGSFITTSNKISANHSLGAGK